METIWQDVFYAARGMRRSPLFAVTAIFTLALGIGGATAMFSIIRAVLLKPLEYRDPGQLVIVSGGATPVRFEEMKPAVRSLTQLGAYTFQQDLTLTSRAQPEVVHAVQISGDFLRILGVPPLLGRSFSSAEDTPGAPPVAMLSAELWKRAFDSDPQIAGKTANISATSYSIVGVLPPRFQFPSAGIDVWIPRPAEWSMMAPQSRPLSPFLTLFGRMRPGVTVQQGNAEMALIHRQYAAAHPAMLDAKPKKPEELVTLKDNLVGSIRSILWILFGAVSLVLLIACANVASLLLARATGRSREIAVRAALGAGRGRLIRQLLAESILLSSAGGIVGILLGAWSLRIIPLLPAFNLPRAGSVHIDWAVLAFAAALSIGTGVLFGLAPSISGSRTDLIRVLRGSGEAASQRAPERVRWLDGRRLLVIGQIALSVILLIGAGLLMESVAHLRQIDLGFNPEKLFTASVSLPLSRYDTNQKKVRFYQELVQRLNALPAVRSATTAMFIPMTGFVGSPVQDAGKPPLPLNQRPIVMLLDVMPDYFKTLSVPMRRGRDFSVHDKDGAPRVAIIDEPLAHRLWPSYPAGVDPVGQRVLIGSKTDPVEIVGVAAHAHQNVENSIWSETIYIPFTQTPMATAKLAIRTGGDPLLLTRMVREQVRAMDRDQPISDVHTMDDLVEEEVGQRRLLVGLLGSFAGIALLLALVGIYGVISYSVTQRVRELGIRWALGARQFDILRLVMGQGLALTLAGVAAGIAGALLLTRVMTDVLFGVTATDPATFAGTGALFSVVALAASYIPARRATRIDPMTALRG